MVKVGKKILIMEDEEVLSSVLARKLRGEGFDVTVVENGEDGMKELNRKSKPDIVLLDIIMPKISGFEVLESMRADGALKEIPVIVISNSGQPVDIERAKALGVKEYLVKATFDPKEVIEKVHAQLDEDARGGPPQKEEGNKPRAGAEAANTAEKGEEGKTVILVVEDDQFLRDLIVRKLSSEGFAVIEAVDGEEGIRRIQEEKPKLILLDIILPGIDGFEVLKRIKMGADELSKIPVIILSNLGQKDDIDRGLQMGAQDYLIKAHFTPTEIVEKVKAVIQENYL